MDSSTFTHEVRKVIKNRIDQPVNLSGVGKPGKGVEIEVPSGSKVRIVLLEVANEISITTKDDQGQSSFNVSADTGMVAVDAVLRVL